MPEFDPYYKWLGIPPEDQPAHHYRLLGVNAFEADRDVIDGAANRVMTYLKQFAAGPDGDLSQQLLNEVAAARLCLLNPQTKADYDTGLRATLRSKRTGVATLAASWQRAVSTWRKFTHSDPRRRLAILCLVPVAFVVLGSTWFTVSLMSPHDSSDTPHTTGPTPTDSTPHVAEAVKLSPEPKKPEKPSPKPKKVEIAKPSPEPKVSEIAEPSKPRSHEFDGLQAGEKTALIPDVAFHWCPAGKFTMGTPRAKNDESPVEVTLTTGFWLSETEVTQRQWQSVMQTQPWKGEKHVQEGGDFPATFITYDDAVSFCEKLTNQERISGRLPQDWKYALPTEAQWEYACRAGTSVKFFFGDDESQLSEYAWYAKNTLPISEEYAHQVGLKKANPWGLSDMHGNVQEWCSDSFDAKLAGGRDPHGPASGSFRVFRGGAWGSNADSCRSADRYCLSPGIRSDFLGFRLAAVPADISSGIPNAIASTPTASTPHVTVPAKPAPEPPKPAIAQPAIAQPEIPQPSKPRSHAFDGVQAGQKRALMPKFAFHWCPAGRFTMGTPGATNDEAPVEVTFTTGFWLGETEVTQGQWRSLMKTQPWKGEQHVKEGPDFPATYITYENAVGFCERLTNQERKSGRLPQDWKFALPTEAQWEYACRAGTSQKFSFGDTEARLSEYAWYTTNTQNRGEEYAHKVGVKKSNPWGLKDMHGNVHEWCSDWFEKGAFEARLKGGQDPHGPTSGSFRVFRGGAWGSNADSCRSADRSCLSPGVQSDSLGFRLAAVPADN